MNSLSNELVRLAYEYPEMRGEILSTLMAGESWGDDDDYMGGEHFGDAPAAPRTTLKNPVNPSCTPLKKKKPENRDGDCYWKHYEYGEAGTDDIKAYMKRYREKAKYTNKTGPQAGKAVREKMTPLCCGKKRNRQTGEVSMAREASYSDEEFNADLQALLKLAYRKSPERKVLNGQCLNSFKAYKDLTDKEKQDAINDAPQNGECYQKWNEYGEANSKSGKRQNPDYYKKYYEEAYKDRKKTEGTGTGSIPVRDKVPKPKGSWTQRSKAKKKMNAPGSSGEAGRVDFGETADI